MIVITRPKDSAEIFAQDLEGYDVFIEPLLEIAELDFDLPDVSAYDGLIFTSANAVRIFAKATSERDKKSYVVGPQTEEVSKELGFLNITSVNGSSKDMAELVQKNPDTYLHVCGEDVTEDLGVDRLVVYKAEKVPVFTPEFIDLIQKGAVEVVTLFSKRTAQHFRDLVEQNQLVDALASTKLLCLSEAVLECVQDMTSAGTYSAPTPNRQGMVALIKETCTRAT